jgi:NADP-dependent 3-hydroxy acid dehydrogenase YdfG
MLTGDYRTAFVTGATSGIGAAVAARLLDLGLQVHVAGRREDRLAKLATKTGCTAHRLDVRDTQAVYALLESLEVDVLINNAGLGRGFQAIFAVPPEDIDTTIQTNVNAAIHVLRAVLPGMTQRKRGHVVNIGSVAGLYPIKSSVYGASKGAVHLLSQNLRVELQGTGVRVTEICPARVRTEFFDVAIDDPETRKSIKETGIQELSAGDIADAIMYAVEAPAHVNINLIEIQPTEQTFGGTRFVPREKPDPPG